MARVDHARHDLTLTVVVYGAPKVGKTTILHCIQDRVAPEKRGPLVPFGTDFGVAPMLDWLPLELGLIGGWRVSVNLYAIPDQRHADATRRLILADADGVMFAADAQAGRITENMTALRSLRDNLDDADGRSRVVPMVYLYTKCDLPQELLLSRNALNHELNATALPDFASSALRGEGVLEALHAVISIVMRQFATRGARAAVARGSIHKRCEQSTVGDSEQIGQGDWPVVCIFDGSGTGPDPEIWGDVTQLVTDFERTVYSSVLVRATDPAAAQALKNRANDDQRKGHQHRRHR